MLAGFLFTALLQSVHPPQTICRKDQLGREFDGDAVPGIELPAGLRTGMSRDEVAQAAPKLSLYEIRTRTELFPGLAFRAAANLERKGKGLGGVTFQGTAREAPIDDLSRRFGTPVKVGEQRLTEPFAPLRIRSTDLRRLKTLKWCDGLKVFVMHLDDDQFTLVATAERSLKRR